MGLDQYDSTNTYHASFLHPIRCDTTPVSTRTRCANGLDARMESGILPDSRIGGGVMFVKRGMYTGASTRTWLDAAKLLHREVTHPETHSQPYESNLLTSRTHIHSSMQRRTSRPKITNFYTNTNKTRQTTLVSRFELLARGVARPRPSQTLFQTLPGPPA
ncbi:hypothetical protein MSAN_00907100 [Mycena sanguinolenta]|uniref:Uncharacterized protein n=1 Tax=Mycena sanguinolenta TaxID=230812 RepID=A0A8H6YXH6_9AGAR|nr:hypothetical protein MSAN_00907100 [Mycena sanguinolenta]